MFSNIAIVVYSCIATANFADYDPHRVNAVSAYVALHPETCRADAPVILDAGVTLEQCRSRAMLHFMPGWMNNHPDRVWLGAKCESREPQDVIMGAAPGSEPIIKE